MGEAEGHADRDQAHGTDKTTPADTVSSAPASSASKMASTPWWRVSRSRTSRGCSIGSAPHHIRPRAIEHKIMGAAAENVYRVVSPLSFEAKVPPGRRFIFAGYGDRLAPPHQAQALWEHWDQPRISWYAGNHVGYLWSKQVSDFMASSLGEGLLANAPQIDRG